MRSHGFPSHYEYQVRLSSGAITKMPRGTGERYARDFAKHAIRVGAMSATVERALTGGGYTTTFRKVGGVVRRRG